MAGENEKMVENLVDEVPSDPWAMAFAALDKEEQENSLDGVDVTEEHDATEPDAGPGTNDIEAGDVDDIREHDGGPDTLDGVGGEENDSLDWNGIDISEDAIANYKKQIEDDVHERVLRDVAQEYIKQGIRNNNGVLGASISDPDICKRDSDGVPRFYNPETKREFTGDNPRRQAQEWVDDYNRELADAFNKTCASYSKKLMQEEQHKIAVVEFAPKYNQLDPMRRSMLDSIIEDYEIRDSDGDVVGYSCDLDRALAAVNRQVRNIQERYSHHQQSVSKQPTGPALDTPTVGNTSGEQTKPQFKSLAEAMEWQQDQLLKNRKGR